MSEEQIKNSEHNCSCKKVLVLVLVTLMFSVATFALTLLNTLLAAQGGHQFAPQAGAPAVQENKDAVVISKQYDKGQSFAKAKATKKPMVVFFYTDWCGFCQRFVPTYHKFSKDKEVKKNFAIAYVNCENQENSKIMQEYQINAFPTVFVIDKEGKRTQIENQKLFAPDAINIMKEEALKLIGESK